MISPFVTVAWLEEHRSDVVLADVRWYLDGRRGDLAYAAGHVPGAVYVDLDRGLAAPPSREGGRHPLPDPLVFASAMSDAGIGDETTVVAYDDEGGVIAARLVWMLRATGHDAALLDGGLAAWPGSLASGPSTSETVPFTPPVWPHELLASIDDVTRPGHVVVDARDADRYRGEREPIDPRAGHIPGARSLPCRENLDATGRLRPIPELRERLRAAGVTEGRHLISYCGSGVTACHNLLVVEHLGLGRGRLLPGSWSQYSKDPERPVATGSEP